MEDTKQNACEESMPDLKDNTLLALSQSEKPDAASPVPFQKQAILEKHEEASLVSPTPEKTREAYRVIRKNDIEQLSEKHKSILDLFNRMTTSLRLLRLRGKSPTLQNISSQVQILTGRKFDYKHLAQIKHVLPEAIDIRKILEHDTKTMCMKPDIMITLIFDIVGGHVEHSDYIALSNTFASRLPEIPTTQLEVYDNDQAEVPEELCEREITNKTNTHYLDVRDSSENELAKPSHFSASFTRRFSRKASDAETEEASHHISRSSTCLDSVTITKKENPKISSDSSSQEITCKIPVLTTDIQENTPIKPLVDIDGLMLETPVQTTPKRSLPTDTCDAKDKTDEHKIATPGSLTAKRSLLFSTFEDEDNFCNSVSENDPKTNTLDGIEETGHILIEKASPSASSICKETNKLNYLSDLVLTIHDIFQSVKYRSITKEELFHKIIMYNCDIDDNSEIVERIEQLEKLVPDWISRELTRSGDLVYSIRKVSDLNSIRDRLASLV